MGLLQNRLTLRLGALVLCCLAALGAPTEVAAQFGDLPQSMPAAQNEQVPPGMSFDGGPGFAEHDSYSMEPDADDQLYVPQGKRYLGGGNSCDYTLQVLPDQVLYRSYLAGGREPRFQGAWMYDRNMGWRWDNILGGRAPVLRWGTTDPIYPEGYSLDIEGAAFVRLDLENNRNVDATDYRFGVPFTRRVGGWESKIAYYHISSHVGDEYLEENPGFERNNYSRDVIVFGNAYRFWDAFRVYGEVGYAWYTSGPAQPWEVQFGLEYSPRAYTGLRGSPYAAANCRLREEVDWGGNVILQAGWQWVGVSGHTFRVGLQYFNGKSDQVIFLNTSEQQLGFGIYYDY